MAVFLFSQLQKKQKVSLSNKLYKRVKKTIINKEFKTFSEFFMPQTATYINDEFKRYRLSDIGPIQTATEDHFFYCENTKKQSYIGACFISSPLNGMDAAGFKAFGSSMSFRLPENSIIQISQIATNHIDSALDEHLNFKKECIERTNEVSNEIKVIKQKTLNNRIDFFNNSKIIPPVKTNDITLRKVRIVVSIKVPADLHLNDYDWQRAKELIYSFSEGLKATTLTDLRQLTTEEFLGEIRSLIEPYSPMDFTYDPWQYISHQTFRKTLVTSNANSNVLKIGDSNVVVLSINSLPKRADISLANALIGDSMGSSKQIGCPYLINYTIIVSDAPKEVAKIDFDYVQTTDTATPFARKINPKINDRIEGLETIRAAAKKGDIPCRVYFNIILFHKDESKLRKIAATVESYYSAFDLHVVADSLILLPLFWNALPLHLSPESIRNSSRTFRSTICVSTVFAPLFADNPNEVERFSQLYMSRRGNLVGFDPMRGQNHNGLIIGASGGGKSVATQNFITQELEAGALVRIIDDGHSYKKHCALFKGTYIEFSENSNVCLNPFTRITNIEEDADQLVLLIKQMASPKTVLTDFALATIKTAIKSCFDVNAQRTTITHVAEYLRNQPEQEVKQLSRQLSDYTKGGTYEKYFEGESNIDLSSPYVVLELSGLRSLENLKTVVMMLVLNRVQSDMYENYHYDRKFVFFEEVTSYFENPIIGKYIRGFAERVRKNRGGCWLVTQNIQSVAESPELKLIMVNLNYIIFLPYVTTEVDKLAKTGIIPTDEYLLTVFKSLKLVGNQYSEMMIYEQTTQNITVARIALSDYEKILYSSSNQYFQPFIDRLNRGERFIDIMDSYMKIANSNKKPDIFNNIQILIDRANSGESWKDLLVEYTRNLMH